MSFIEEQWDTIVEFNKIIFDYFNHTGKINVMVPAKLVVSPITTSDITLAGQCMYPNTVYIYPVNIERYTPTIKGYIIENVETIIHELFHVDQLYVSSAKITYDVENSVEFMTHEYIMNHLLEIKDLINYTFSSNIIEDENEIKHYITPYKVSNNSKFSWYNRKCEYDHILVAIINMLGVEDSQPYIIKIYDYLDKGYGLNYIINDTLIKILWMENNEMKIINVNDFNNLMYESYFKDYQHYINMNNVKLDIDENNKVITFKLNARGQNTMCEIVNDME